MDIKVGWKIKILNLKNTPKFLRAVVPMPFQIRKHKTTYYNKKNMNVCELKFNIIEYFLVFLHLGKLLRKSKNNISRL